MKVPSGLLGQRFRLDPAQLGHKPRRIGGEGRLADLPAMRDRREERCVGFDEQATLGQFSGYRLQIFGILEGYDSR